MVFNKEVAMFIDGFGVPRSLSVSCVRSMDLRLEASMLTAVNFSMYRV